MKAWREFPGVLTLDEARSHANERLAIYAGPDNGAWADSGALERWEKETDDQDELDRYVLRALNCDLTDYGRKLIRDKQREPQPVRKADETDNDGALVSYFAGLLDSKSFEDWEYMRDSGRFPRQDYPLLYALKVDGLTRAEVETLLREQAGWTQDEFQARLAAEKAALAQAFYQR
jgi:hypothetical protein